MPATQTDPSLGTRNASATVAVKDLRRAREFYQGKLGLQEVATEGDEVVVYRTGSSQLLVYVSQFAGTNQATAVTWVVEDDLEALVQALKSKDIRFEHYDLPDMKRTGDIHTAGHTRVAWFKDPDGNIISLVNG